MFGKQKCAKALSAAATVDPGTDTSVLEQLGSLYKQQAYSMNLKKAFWLLHRVDFDMCAIVLFL